MVGCRRNWKIRQSNWDESCHLMIGMTRVNRKLTRMEKHPAEAMVAIAGCFIYKLVEMPLLYLKLNSATHTYTKTQLRYEKRQLGR